MISFTNWPNVRVITIYWSYFSGMSMYLKFCPKKTEWPYSLTRVCDLKKPYSFLLDKLMLYADFMFSELLLRSYVNRKATPTCKTTLLSWFNSNIRHWCIDEHLINPKVAQFGIHGLQMNAHFFFDKKTSGCLGSPAELHSFKVDSREREKKWKFSIQSFRNMSIVFIKQNSQIKRDEKIR